MFYGEIINCKQTRMATSISSEVLEKRESKKRESKKKEILTNHKS